MVWMIFCSAGRNTGVVYYSMVNTDLFIIQEGEEDLLQASLYNWHYQLYDLQLQE